MDDKKSTDPWILNPKITNEEAKLIYQVLDASEDVRNHLRIVLNAQHSTSRAFDMLLTMPFEMTHSPHNPRFYPSGFGGVHLSKAFDLHFGEISHLDKVSFSFLPEIVEDKNIQQNNNVFGSILFDEAIKNQDDVSMKSLAGQLLNDVKDQNNQTRKMLGLDNTNNVIKNRAQRRLENKKSKKK